MFDNINFKLLIILLVAVIVYLFIKGTTPVPYYDIKIWNKERTSCFKYTEYTSGVFGGGFCTIEINKKQILKYRLGPIYGGWKNNKVIKIVANDLPTKKYDLNNLSYNIEVIKAKEFNDFISDKFLVKLNK